MIASGVRSSCEVGAEREPLHDVLERASRGEHQDPGLRTLLAQRAADVVAVDLRQIAVEHDHVIADRGSAERSY
jgi:hypothetical protein